MSQYATDHLAEDHYRTLVRLAAAEHAARQVRRASATRSWRQAVGQALITAGVGLGAPPRERTRALRQARRLLACEDC